MPSSAPFSVPQPSSNRIQHINVNARPHLPKRRLDYIPSNITASRICCGVNYRSNKERACYIGSSRNEYARLHARLHAPPSRISISQLISAENP